MVTGLDTDTGTALTAAGEGRRCTSGTHTLLRAGPWAHGPSGLGVVVHAMV